MELINEIFLENLCLVEVDEMQIITCKHINANLYKLHFLRNDTKVTYY